MALTGKTLLQYLAQKVHQPYTNFLGGTIKANRLFLDAFLAILDNRYNEVEFQKYRDDINFLIKTGKVFVPNNNKIYQANLQLTGVVVAGTVGTFTTFLPHNFIVGDAITTSGIAGTFVTPPNGNLVILTTPTANTFTATVGATGGAYTIPNQGIVTSAKIISDYWQIDQVMARFDVPFNGVTITGATNAATIVITLDKRTNLRTGSRVFISGAVGNTNTNGLRYLKKLNDFQFSLFADKYLLTPIAGNGSYSGTGIISQVNYNTCRPYLPKTKIDSLAVPAADDPKYEDAENMFKFYPLDITCKEIIIDYFKRPDVLVDVADDTIDLTLYYNEQFLMSGLLNVAARVFAEESRDVLLYQQSQSELKQSS